MQINYYHQKQDFCHFSILGRGLAERVLLHLSSRTKLSVAFWYLKDKSSFEQISGTVYHVSCEDDLHHGIS